MNKTVKYFLFMLAGASLTLNIVGCEPKKKDKTASAPNVVNPNCLPGQCPNSPNGPVISPNTYTRYPYGWSGSFQIEDFQAYNLLLQSISPSKFCEKDRRPRCSDMADLAWDAEIAGNAIHDGTMFIGVDRLDGNPYGEVGLNLVKTLNRQWQNTQYGGHYVGLLGPVDMFSGQFNLFKNNSARILTSRGRAGWRATRRYEFVVKTPDLNSAQIEVELQVDGVTALSATLDKTFNFRSNSTFLSFD